MSCAPCRVPALLENHTSRLLVAPLLQIADGALPICSEGLLKGTLALAWQTIVDIIVISRYHLFLQAHVTTISGVNILDR